MSRSSTQPTRVGGTKDTRSSRRGSGISPLDSLEEIKQKSGYTDAKAAAEYLSGKGWIPSKEMKELDAVAVSNALYSMAHSAQGKELLDGINAVAAIILDTHLEATSTQIADRITEHVADRLTEEIESQMSNLEKQLEEKTTVVLSMVDQAYDKIRQVTEKLESTTHAVQQTTRQNETPAPLHTTHPTSSLSYASVVHSHLPTSHLSNIARQRAQKRRILLDSLDKTEHSIKDLSEAQIVAKANLALEQMADDAPPAGKFTGARILRNGGVVIEANEEDLVAWVQHDARREIFLNEFDGGQTQIKDKLYSVILEFVPISHKPGNQPEYRHIEGTSHIDEGHLESTKWMKPVERRMTGQRTAHVLAKFRSPHAANQAIRDGIIIMGKMVYGRKLQQEPRRYMKCQHIGPHIAAQCPQDVETCGTCGKTHAMKECQEQNTDHFWCVNCGHASWDRMCPSFRDEAEKMKRRDPVSTYRFFPVEETQ